MDEIIKNTLIIILVILAIVFLVGLTVKCMIVKKKKRQLRKKVKVSYIYNTTYHQTQIPSIEIITRNDSSVQSTSCDFSLANLNVEEQLRAYELYSNNAQSKSTQDEYKRPTAYNPNF